MNQVFDENHQKTLRSGITLYPSQNQSINKLLGDLIKKVPAQFVLLADVTGQIVSVRGEQNKIDLIALGSLVAGDLAASQEIARITGQYQDFQVILREGKHTNSFILETGTHLALFVQVTHDVPLGWARMVILNTAKDITDILTTTPPEVEQNQTTASSQPLFDDEKLPDLFNDALDDLWME